MSYFDKSIQRASMFCLLACLYIQYLLFLIVEDLVHYPRSVTGSLLSPSLLTRPYEVWREGLS